MPPSVFIKEKSDQNQLTIILSKATKTDQGGKARKNGGFAEAGFMGEMASDAEGTGVGVGV